MAAGNVSSVAIGDCLAWRLEPTLPDPARLSGWAGSWGRVASSVTSGRDGSAKRWELTVCLGGGVPASQLGVCLAWGLNQLALLRTFKRIGWQLGCRILCHFGPLWLGEVLGIDVVVMAGRRIRSGASFCAPGTPCCRRTCLLAVGHVVVVVFCTAVVEQWLLW